MTTDPVLTIELGFVPPAVLRGNSRGHWAAKAKATKNLRVSGYWRGVSIRNSERVLPVPSPVLRRASVQYVYHNPRAIDSDNFVIGMKPFLDGLVDAGVLVDDDPEHVRLEAPEWVKCKRGEEKTVVRIRRLL